MAFDANDLSPHEHFVMERARAGEVADFTPMAGSDGEKPGVRAGFLRKLMLGVDPAWVVRAPGVRIRGARIEGALDLTDCSGAGGASLPALSLEHCDAPELIDLSRARLAQVSLRTCRLRELRATASVIEGELELGGTKPFGAPGVEALRIDLSEIRIAGNLRASGAALARAGDDEAPVLIADGAEIGGDLRLDDDFETLGCVSLAQARIGGALRCSGAQLLNRSDDARSAALIARGARIGGDVCLGENLKAEGAVDFSGADIGGDVNLAHSSIRNEFGAALLLSNTRIAGQLSGGAKFHGHVGLRGAEIARSIDLKGAEIANPLTPRADSFGVALDAAGLKVAGALLLQGANIKGELLLADAQIGGAFALGGGRFINGGGWAIRAQNIGVGGDLTLKIEDGGFAPHGQKTVVEGGASFERAQIGGAFAWHNLELRGPGPDDAKGGVFSLAGARIAGPLRARGLITHRDGRIDASGAHCAALDDDAKTGWGAESAQLAVDGFTYTRIENNDEPWRHRLAWLKRMKRFTPSPYARVAQAYARAGRREDARRILLAQRDQRTLVASAGPVTWVLSSLFGLIAGYGLSPLRMLRALALFVAIGVGGVFVMNGQGALVTADGRQCAGAVEPALYAIDVALPIVDLGQASRCAPGSTARAELPAGMEVASYSDWRIFEGVAIWRWAHALYALLGALLTALAVITFSGVLKPRE